MINTYDKPETLDIKRLRDMLLKLYRREITQMRWNRRNEKRAGRWTAPVGEFALYKSGIGYGLFCIVEDAIEEMEK